MPGWLTGLHLLLHSESTNDYFTGTAADFDSHGSIGTGAGGRPPFGRTGGLADQGTDTQPEGGSLSLGCTGLSC